MIVLPPGEWDPKIRIEPPKKVLSADKRLAFNHQYVGGSMSRIITGTVHLPPRKSVFSLNELGQVNGTAGGGGGGLVNDEEMPEQHELGEELAFTGRWVTQDSRTMWASCLQSTH